MRSFTKMVSLTVFTLSVLSFNEIHAFCAKCAQIEQERAEEQAKKGPQPIRYYDEEFKNQISNVDNKSTSTNTATVNPSQINTNIQK